MKKKRIINLFLIVCLLLSTISLPTFAAEEDGKGLEKAIVAAKNVITVPDNYTDFRSSSEERDTSNGKVRVWRLNWREKEDKSGFISASVDEDGFLYEYNRYNDNENPNGLAKVTKEKAQASAEEFLSKVVPNYSSQMKKVEDDSNTYSNEEYYFKYQRFVNEVPVNFVNVNIGVNKYTGEVTSYNGGSPEGRGIQYPNKDGIIQISEAEKGYVEKLGVKLKYYSYYDYSKNKMNIFAGYSINENKNKAIDGKTGQVVSLYKDDPIYNMKDLANGVTADKSVVQSKPELTKEEIDAVNSVRNLITKEKAENILRQTFDIVTSDMKLKDASLNKDIINDKYIWNISIDGAYGEVDAKSGEIINFSYYKDNNVKGDNISKAQGQNTAEAFLKKNVSDKFNQTKLEDIKEPILKIATTNEEKTFSFNYIRQVNGIEFSNNSLNVEVDNASGKVIGYNNRWYDNASFPAVNQAMNKEAAFNIFKQLEGFQLEYARLDKNVIGLVYNFKDNNGEIIIDPISGVRLDYTGKAYKENKLPEYTDIKGHWSEKIVKELLDNGYYINQGKFNPDNNITQIDFFKYLYSPVRNSYNTDDEFYDMLVQNGIIKKEEKSPNSIVSNGEAAKFATRYLGYEKIALHSEIFNNPFKDNIDDKYKGYAAICYSLKVIAGTNGNFDQNHNLSNADAAVIVYNLINLSNKS